MGLARRHDKRRGNESDVLPVTSTDVSIGANKGVRSLSGARSGRFAADMRAHVGGYGRADQTWGVDHPWHSSGGGALFAQLCAKDHMEEGVIEGDGDDEDQMMETPMCGLSRAQLKKRKAKLKKTGLSAQEAAVKALEEAKDATQRRKDEELRRLEQVKRKRQDAALRKKQKKQQQEKSTLATKLVDEKEVEAKRAEKRKVEKQKKKDERQKVVEQTEQQRKVESEAMKTRETLAAVYEKVVGSEVTTKSGLVLQDQRIGKGKLPSCGDMLTVKYRGRLGRDGLVFGKGMLTTTFGSGSVIAGWEEGMATMRPGGVRLLTIPPELGYGESGKGDKIPRNATLFFEVELVRIGKRKREAIDESDIPLPNAFQRKRIKQTPGKQCDEKENDGDGKLSKSQQKRRRRNRIKNQSEVVAT
uniref:peptidylprolyl isomerase n=1 Tax=Hyaloperonospora arabidopsidis (strain Emoy2) TaxID=559515 RepID=M4BFC5_HYAAE